MPAPSPPDYGGAGQWGSGEVAAFFPGFKHLNMKTSGAVIRLRHGGSGPPLLLLHGNPQNHVSWHRSRHGSPRVTRVLPICVAMATVPSPIRTGQHPLQFSRHGTGRRGNMDHLGYEKFFLAGVDRGGRTAHRLCLDHPERVIKVCLMDVVPNITSGPTHKNWVIGTWHWAFMAQPEPFPERMIGAVPAEFFLKSRMTIRGGTGVDFFDPIAMAEYIRCYTPKTIAGSCRDYRATATSDFAIDTADKDRKIDMPAMIVWGARGQPPERAREFVQIWEQYASRIEHTEGFHCGHYIAEEIPDTLYDRFRTFFVEQPLPGSASPASP